MHPTRFNNKFALTLFACTLLFLTACTKKDYTCRCDGGITGQGQTKIFSNTGKAKAKNDCALMESPSGTADGFTNCRVE